MRLFAPCIVALVMWATVCALGQTPSQPVKTESSDSPATGTISGKVINENGQPLAGALVQIRAINSSTTGPGRMTNANRAGEFRVDGLDRATYTVTASLAAYTPQPRDPSATQQPTYHLGDSVTLTLMRGGVVTGAVTNANGEPVVAVTVRAQMSRDANGRRTANGSRRESLTDDRGIYRVYGLPTGTYVVSAGGPNQYGPAEENGFETDVPTYAPASTRDTATEISVRGGEEVPVDIRYRGEQGRTISGVVNAPNSGGFNVVLSASGEGAVPWSTTFYQAYNVDGFVFKGIADGEYQLLATAYGRGTGPRDVAAAVKRVIVRGADVSGIELTPAPLATVSGRVVFEESKLPECTDKQRPEFNEVVVSAWHNDTEAAKNTPASLWSIGAPTAADADGNFSLRNLATGEYYFATRFTAKYWYLHSITLPAPPAIAAAKVASKPVDATVVWTKLKAGDRLSGLTVTLAQGAAILRGQLVSEGQQVPEKLFVYLVPSEREKAEAVLRYYAAPVSPDGKIALNNIAPGRYWVLAQTFNEDAVTPLTKLRLPHETATRARLRRDAEAGKTELELKPCQNVSDFQLPFKR